MSALLVFRGRETNPQIRVTRTASHGLIDGYDDRGTSRRPTLARPHKGSGDLLPKESGDLMPEEGAPDTGRVSPEEWYEERMRAAESEGWDDACSRATPAELGFELGPQQGPQQGSGQGSEQGPA